MKKECLISIVIPTYKGADSIGPLIAELIDLIGEKRLEITIVNDRSPDHSHEVCTDIQNKYPFVVNYILLSKNVGEHGAVLAGMNYASGDYVVIMDDDFQNTPHEVLKLVRYVEQNECDVLYTYYENKYHSLFRNFGSWFNDRIATILLKKPKGLYLSSFKCLSRKIAKSIIIYDGPFPYIDGLILATTRNIDTLKVEHASRKEGSSGYTVSKLVTLWLNMATNFSVLPLRISFVLGLVLNALGFIYAVNIIIQKMLNPDLPMGWASLFLGILVFSGVQLLLIGILGEYVGKILLNVNKLPQFHVDKKSLRSGYPEAQANSQNTKQ